MYWLRDHPQYGMPGGSVGLSPWLDLTLSHPSYFFYTYHHPLAYSFNRFILNRPHDYLTAIIGDENGNMVSKSKGLLNSNRVHHYVPCNSQLFDPYISPVYAHVRVTYVSKL